uniref:Scribble planar cell polarity protein n=1 Tax=Callorhinchus milii TaxID=7868 RepID=A0A4W3GMS8_CALMI
SPPFPFFSILSVPTQSLSPFCVYIPEIPESIKFCKSLEIADFSGNPLSRLPDGFTQLRSLAHLSLNDVSLQSLPNDIGNLANLVTLELRENLLKFLPTIDVFTRAEIAVFSVYANDSCFIVFQPDTLGALPNLRELWLDRNQLTALPAVRDHTFHLLGGAADSSTHTLTLALYTGQLKQLSILKVDQNRLSHLPETLGDCGNLTELILTENLLTCLPKSLGRLKKLTNLNVDRNRLSLNVLSLRDNRLTHLPPQLANAAEIHVLDVAGNRLQNLPFALTNLNLKALWLAENQSQPMLKFQTEDDEETGDKVLTCYLLPQQPSPSLENLLNDSIEEPWPEPNLNRVSVIQFIEEPRESEQEQEEAERRGRLQRRATPHPSELKVMKQAIEDRRGETLTNKAQELPESPPAQVRMASLTVSRDFGGNELSLRRSLRPQLTVRFSEDTVQRGEEEEDGPPIPEKQRLMRKDTPHYKKQLKICKLPKPEAVLAMLQAAQPNQGQGEDQSEVQSQGQPTSHSPEQEEEEEEDTDHRMSQPPVKGVSFDQVNNLLIEPARIEEEELTLTIHRQIGGLGISIAGGKGSTPYKGEDEGIFISRVSEEGPAARAGVRVGDKLLEVNGVGLRDAEHHKAVEALRSSGTTVTMAILRERMVESENPITTTPLRPQDDYAPRDRRTGLRFLTEPGLGTDSPPTREQLSTSLARSEKGLGFSIAGGKGSTAYRTGDVGIFISRLAEGGAAHTDGILRVGDQVMSVNGIDLRHATHQEAVLALLSNTQQIHLLVRHDPPPPGMHVLLDRAFVHPSTPYRPCPPPTPDPNSFSCPNP